MAADDDTGPKPRATTTPADTEAGPGAMTVPDGTDRGAMIVRGSIDCLARLSDGRVVIVEIKTGQPREWHREQLEWYLVAARSLFPGRSVEGLVLYA